MRFLSLLTLLILSPSLLANTVYESRVYDVDRGEKVDDEVLVLFTNGKVTRLSAQENALIDELEEMKSAGAWAQFSFDEAGRLTDIELQEDRKAEEVFPSINKGLQSTYVPSVVENHEARTLFSEMKRHQNPASQCHERAHVWSFEWRINHNVFSSKAWIFFTRKYLRQNPKFEWWYHVAPMLYVNIGGHIKERIMDRNYSIEPITIKRWTEIFMKDKASCPLVDTWSDHSLYQDHGSCYLQKSSMYYYRPVDLEFLEKFGNEKHSWIEAEVREAYTNSFEKPVVTTEGESR